MLSVTEIRAYLIIIILIQRFNFAVIMDSCFSDEDPDL